MSSGRGRILAEALSTVLTMKLSDFLKKFSDLLPKYTLVSVEENLEKVLEHISEGYHYMVIVDKRRRVRGIIFYLDLIYSIGHPHFEQIPAVLNILHFRRRMKVPVDVLLKTPVDEFMKGHPPTICEERTVGEAVDLMHKVHRNYVLVLSSTGEVRGVVTAHAVLRAALREAGLTTGPHHEH